MIYNGQQHYEVLNALLRDNNALQLGIMVEVGVRHGDTAEFLCRNNPDLYLILVDPYPPYIDVGYEFTKEEQDKIKAKAAKRLENYTVQWIYQTSVEAASKFKEKIDAVFIDSCHTYEHAKADIASWYPHIRKGGLLTGHDYSMDGVNKAVNEWAEANKKSIFHSGPATDVWAIEV